MANILSLFDGMACGYLAMMDAGIPVDRYVSYEIDKYATKTSKHNFHEHLALNQSASLPLLFRHKTETDYEVKDGKITIKGKEYPIKLVDGYYIIRKLTVRECMRLQTVPEWYEFPVSNSQAYKMIGNGWTVKVISHLIGCIGDSNE